MPKILINEIDRTTAGTPGEYSNNSVLICGFSTRTNEEIIAEMAVDPRKGYILPDENGIFEFYSQNDFKDTIGKVAPVLSDDANVPAHYGNQMAYELLGQGYPSVIYISLGKVPDTSEKITEVLRKISDPDTWEIFKDKASYDFRFVTHGLLTSCDNHDTVAATAAKDAAISELTKAQNALADAQKALADAQAEGEALKKGGTLKDGKEVEKIIEAAEKAVAEAEQVVAAATTSANQAIASYNHTTSACFTASDFNEANKAIMDLVLYVQEEDYEAKPGTGRGDCTALIEVNESLYVNSESGRPEAKIIAAAETMGVTEASGPYCACTVPSAVYKMTADTAFGDNKKFPGAFHYLVCYKRMIDSNYPEWFAAAGYTRGVSSYTIDHTTVKLGEVAIQALEPRYKRSSPYNYTIPFAVNVIANFRGSYYLWGNRTCALLDEFDGGGDLTAQHFLNIRQLCTTIKKQLYVSCRRFTFDPNSDVLWINFKNSITPTLDRMKANQGVRDYKIEKVYTDKKATLRARIRIVPIEAVEDFVLEISLEDSLGEATVTITE